MNRNRVLLKLFVKIWVKTNPSKNGEWRRSSVEPWPRFILHLHRCLLLGQTKARRGRRDQRGGGVEFDQALADDQRCYHRVLVCLAMPLQIQQPHRKVKILPLICRFDVSQNTVSAAVFCERFKTCLNWINNFLIPRNAAWLTKYTNLARFIARRSLALKRSLERKLD